MDQEHAHICRILIMQMLQELQPSWKELLYFCAQQLSW